MASAPLVTVPALQASLGLEPGTDDANLQVILDGVIGDLLKATDRVECPFSDAIPNRVERIRATQAERIWLDYPIAAVSAIALGSNKNAPDQTLDPSDTSAVAFEIGGTELTRVDGGCWDSSLGDLLSWARGGPMVPSSARRGAPSFVWVTYTTKDFRPADVVSAALNVSARIYQRRGSEGVKSETLGAYSYTLGSITEDNDQWQGVIDRYRRRAFL